MTLAERMRLDGRVAIVAGGGGYIGRATSLTLAQQGAEVVLLDRSLTTMKAAAELQELVPQRVRAIQVDLEDEAATRAVPDRVVAEHGRLDILVHCAALVGDTPLPGWAVPFQEQSAETWRRALEVNLTSAFVLTQASAPSLAAQAGAAIVLVGSIYGSCGPDLRLYQGTGMGNPAAYAASKGGLAQFARAMATTLAPEVRVNVVSPGGVARGQEEAFQRRYEERVPLKRMATETDVADAVAFLCSDAAAYVTGQNLFVDGGWTAW